MNQESKPQGTPPTRAECGSDGSLRGSLAGVKPGRGICVCAVEMYTLEMLHAVMFWEGARSLTLALKADVNNRKLGSGVLHFDAKLGMFRYVCRIVGGSK